MRSVISLLTVLSSLEKGQDQNDEKLWEEKMSLSVCTLILSTALGPSLKEKVWVSRGRRVTNFSDPQVRELAVYTLELPECFVLSFPLCCMSPPQTD